MLATTERLTDSASKHAFEYKKVSVMLISTIISLSYLHRHTCSNLDGSLLLDRCHILSIHFNPSK